MEDVVKSASTIPPSESAVSTSSGTDSQVVTQGDVITPDMKPKEPEEGSSGVPKGDREDGYVYSTETGTWTHYSKPDGDYHWVVDSYKKYGVYTSRTDYDNGKITYHWYTTGGHWESGASTGDNGGDKDTGDTEDTPTDPGSFGKIFQDMGYKYLGPGTDLEYNKAHNVEPIDELDRAAMVHDNAYARIKYQLQWGLMNYYQALDAVHKADSELIMRGYEIFNDSWDYPSMAVAEGMTYKMFYDYATNSASFAQISESDWKKNLVALTEDQRKQAVAEAKAEAEAKEKAALEEAIRRAQEEHQGQRVGPPQRFDPGPPASVVPYQPRTSRRVTYDDDRDRNYFPDRAQVSRRRVRRRPYFRRSVRSRYHGSRYGGFRRS